MNPYKTDRGLHGASFLDLYDNQCSIQESSLATDCAIWLGMSGGDLPHRMLLTQEMVAELLPYLHKFVETGELED